MKKVVSLAFVVSTAMITFLQTAISQTAKDIFNSTDMTVTYLGVDFSQARLINDAAASASDLKEKHFPGINQVVVNEPKNMTCQRLSGKRLTTTLLLPKR